MYLKEGRLWLRGIRIRFCKIYERKRLFIESEKYLLLIFRHSNKKTTGESYNIVKIYCMPLINSQYFYKNPLI